MVFLKCEAFVVRLRRTFLSRDGLIRMFRHCNKWKNHISGASAERARNGSESDLLTIEYDSSGSDRKRIIMPAIWFRDHCQHDLLYSKLTKQRKQRLTDIIADSRLANEKQIIYDEESQMLHIFWHDGHRSTFTAEQIFKLAFEQESEEKKLRNLWNGFTMKVVPKLSRSSFDFEHFAKMFIRYGFVVVSDVQPDAPSTREICERVASIHNTFYGDFWTFGTSDDDQTLEREDTAYGNEEIGPHTDCAYFEQTPGMQVFHCLKSANFGGDTILVDGFHAATYLLQEYPDYFKLLAQMPISHQYLESVETESGRKTFFAKSSDCVIKLNGCELQQIRFNPYDRAALHVNAFENLDQLISFYKAYQQFSRIIHRPENFLKISLQPGTVLFIDNFRVLHARSAFSGVRRMCGCYLSRDDFMAKVRPVLVESCEEKNHVKFQ